MALWQDTLNKVQPGPPPAPKYQSPQVNVGPTNKWARLAQVGAAKKQKADLLTTISQGFEQGLSSSGAGRFLKGATKTVESFGKQAVSAPVGLAKDVNKEVIKPAVQQAKQLPGLIEHPSKAVTIVKQNQQQLNSFNQAAKTNRISPATAKFTQAQNAQKDVAGLIAKGQSDKQIQKYLVNKLTSSNATAKRLFAEAGGTALLFAGGGELKGVATGAKTLLKSTSKNSVIGGLINVASTIQQKPNASEKEIRNAFKVGAETGAGLTVAGKVIGKAVTSEFATKSRRLLPNKGGQAATDSSQGSKIATPAPAQKGSGTSLKLVKTSDGSTKISTGKVVPTTETQGKSLTGQPVDSTILPKKPSNPSLAPSTSRVSQSYKSVNLKTGNVLTRSNFGNFLSDAKDLAVQHVSAVDRGDVSTAKSIENRVAKLPTAGASKLVGKLQNYRASAAEVSRSPSLTQKIPTAETSSSDQLRGFTKSVKQSSNFSPELRKAVSSKYSIFSDKQAVSNTENFLNQPFDKAHQQVLQRLGSEPHNKQLTNDAGTVMQILDSKGRTAEAQVIHDKLAAKATEAGQGNQATALLLRRSPDGIYHKAVSDLSKSKINVTPEIDKQLQGLREEIRKTAPDTPEREYSVQKMKQFVEQNLPSSIPKKIYAIWRSGLITGGRTLTKVGTSHIVHGTVETVKDIPASVVDATVGRTLSKIFTGEGKRSLVLTTRGSAKGTVQSVKSIGKYLKTGIDISRGANNDFHASVYFGKSIPGRIANVYVNGPGRLHGSIYNTAAGGAHLRSLYSQGLAEARNQGLKGAEKNRFLESFVAKPPRAAADVAQQEAEQATMRQKTLMSDLITRLTNTKSKEFNMVAKIIVPFSRIPAAIANGIIDYSPAGAMKTIVKTIRTAKANEGWSIGAQRQFSAGLGRSITGTTGAMIPGIMLYNRGLLTTSYPTDPKEQKLWQLQGKTAWSVKIGGKWRALGTLGPTGLVIAMGGGIAEARKNGEDMFSATVAGMATGLKSLQDQSYLSGVNAAVGAIEQGGSKVIALEKQYAGSIVPTLIANIAATQDKNVRTANTPLDTLKSKIPGVREGLPTTKDAFGKPVPSPGTGVGALFDPFYSSNARPSTPLITELQRLQSNGYGVMPSTVPTSQKIGGYVVPLNKQQAQELQAKRGQALQGIWDKIVASPLYKNLSDDTKNKILSTIEKDVTSEVKTRYILSRLANKQLKVQPPVKKKKF